MDDHCFIFLKDEYPDWCQKCEKMEKRIMEGDGISAITICGKIAEQISKEICIKKSLDDLCSESQYERNNELKMCVYRSFSIYTHLIEIFYLVSFKLLNI